MTPRKQVVVVIACAMVLLVGAVGIVFLVDPENPHEPISITDDLSFIQENGVVQGNGSSQNPYVIEGWDIVAPYNGSGIHIRDTDAHLLIRNVDIRSNGSSYFGICLEHARNVTLENVRMTGNWNGVRLCDCLNVMIRRCDASSNVYGGFQVFSSGNISITESRAMDNPQNNLWVGSSNTCNISGNDFRRGNDEYQDNQLYIQRSANITYSANVMKLCYLRIENCTGCTVSRNEFIHTTVLLWEADCSAFVENTMTDNSYLEIWDCDDLTVDRDYPYPPGP